MTGPDRGGGNLAASAVPPRGGHDVLNLPNIITFARLCAVPAAVWLVIQRETGLAFGLFALAGVSDAEDGWLARRRGGSARGALLGFWAGLLTAAGLRTQAEQPFYDLVIVGGLMVMWQLAIPVRIKPMLFSKLNTALQLLLVGVVLLLEGFGLQAPWLRALLIWTVAATTLGSGAAYVWKAARHR